MRWISGSPASAATGAGGESGRPARDCNVLAGITKLAMAAAPTARATMATIASRDWVLLRICRRLLCRLITSRCSASRSRSTLASFVSLSRNPLRSITISRSIRPASRSRGARLGGARGGAGQENLLQYSPPVRPGRRASCPMARPAFSRLYAILGHHHRQAASQPLDIVLAYRNQSGSPSPHVVMLP